MSHGPRRVRHGNKQKGFGRGESERTRLLREGIILQRELNRNRGKGLSEKEMEQMLAFSKKVDSFEARQANPRVRVIENTFEGEPYTESYYTDDRGVEFLAFRAKGQSEKGFC